MNKYEENVYKNLFEYPTKKIVELELENEKLQEEKDHYKHLYSEVKKQKDDVVEYIKEHTHNVYASGYRNPKTGMLEDIEKTPIINRVLQANPDELLRMLGEIDEIR